jgi:asparagine synthase (glutamine-hydrolysing)
MVASTGAIYNRTALSRVLMLDAGKTNDAILFEQAYRRWGADCLASIHGDWSLAVWHPDTRHLVLARDHGGNTSLYYQDTPGIFAFATSRRALLALDPSPVEMDEFYLAQMLISWPGYHGERTIHAPVRRLPPAHFLTLSPQGIQTRRYWRLEEVAERPLSARDAIEGLRDIFDLAVRERLPTGARVATTLSGGLDSGAVAVTAAGMLGELPLTAYCSVPMADPRAFAGTGSGDEYGLALATARSRGNIDLRRIDARISSPVQAMRETLDIVMEPQHAAANFHWLLDLYRTAAHDGHQILLTGQAGNGGISWPGGIESWALRRQLCAMGAWQWSKWQLRTMGSAAIDRLWRKWRAPARFDQSAIAQPFADRIRLRERLLDDPEQAPYPRGRAARLSLLKPGRSHVGALHAELGAATGIQVRDPTGDARVLAFCLSLPDRAFVDPISGRPRWLIREAMRGRLPDPVRLNTIFGVQAADIVFRLRTSRDEVEAAIEEIAKGRAAEYVDAPRLHGAWQQIRAEDSPQSYRLAVTVLTRGIMAGLFVNGLGKRW